MGSNSSPCNRGNNVGVKLDLGDFTSRLFTAVGAEVHFNGPGPCSAVWLSNTTSTAERFAIDYLATELFSKFDDGVKSPAKKEKAVQRFIEGETLCSLTNCKFSPLPSGQPPAWLDIELLPDDIDPLDARIFSRARQICSQILGAFPGWQEVLQYADFGPGATTRLSRRHGHRSNKWAGQPHATLIAASPLEIVFDELPLLISRLEGPGVEICPGNKLDWVPKNYKTDRTIAIEPDWNMFLQKGLGGLIRRKLKRVKQDLDDQETNRFLAALGSITEELATLDLSMASDTVAYRLVEYLIRPDWFEALQQCRSQIGFYTLDSSEDYHESFTGESRMKVHDLTPGVSREHAVVFEKFSSMGNGFTFELESLIFYGLLRAVSESVGEADHRLYVYGDDLVIPTGMADVAMTFLRKAGFMVNDDKSFTTGPFRESCGGHYFEGVDVTPFYVREPVDSIDRLFLLHNNVHRWFNRFPGITSPECVHELLVWIRAHAPVKWRRPRLMTEDIGDGGFIGAFDEVCPKPAGRSFKRRGWEGWSVETLQYKRKRTYAPRRPVHVDCLNDCCTDYPEKSGPDLASLWKLEGVKPISLVYPGQCPRMWLSTLKSKADVEEWFPSGTDSDVPYTERWWYLATQVLPWKPGTRWW